MPKILIVAGEHSGDDLGANLMAELKKQRSDITFIGVGGSKMKAAGMQEVFPLADIAVMGLFEIIPHLPRLINRLNLLTRIAKQEKVDMVLTIDAPDFTLRLAKRLKKALNVPCLHYVSPSVWAWRPGRAKQMASFLDHLFVLFPFEPPFFAKVGLPCTYVGHPLAHSMASFAAAAPAKLPAANAIALLPGSRVGEVSRLLPHFKQTLLNLQAQNPQLEALIPLAGENVTPLVQEAFADVPNVTYLTGTKEDVYAELQKTRAALVCSGTANLELALLGVPMVVAYQMAPLTHQILKWLVTAPYISPVNLVADSKVVPELIQTAVTPQALTDQVAPLLQNSPVRAQQVAALTNARQALGVSKPAAQIAAPVVLSYIK